jgi:cold shock CspA family protein
MEAQRLIGIIRSWKPLLKYGFVFSPDDDVEFFLHENDLMPKNKPKVLVGHTVEFSPSQSEKGYRALDAVITSDFTVVE